MGSRRKKSKSKIEVIKENSNYLHAPLAEEVGNDSTHFGKEAIQVLKFHGTYQQDDRDFRQGRVLKKTRLFFKPCGKLSISIR